jgi:hypothetical protein
MSDAQTYYWLHSMNVLGQVNAGVTADDPLATCFNQGGTNNYVAHNYSGTSKTVNFSDGGSLFVPAYSLVSSLQPREPIIKVVSAALVEGVGISWPTTEGSTYTVEWADELGSNVQWNSLGPVVQGDWTTKTVFDPVGIHSNRYYRGIETP